MTTVKPYIITIKTIICYEDPAPTVEQVLNELNIDAVEISIEEALVSPKATKPPTSMAQAGCKRSASSLCPVSSR